MFKYTNSVAHQGIDSGDTVINTGADYASHMQKAVLEYQKTDLSILSVAAVNPETKLALSSQFIQQQVQLPQVYCTKCHATTHYASGCGKVFKCDKCGSTSHKTGQCPILVAMKKLCQNCGKTGHGYWMCPKHEGMGYINCQRCKLRGHIALDCNEANWFPSGGGGGSQVAPQKFKALTTGQTQPTGLSYSKTAIKNRKRRALKSKTSNAVTTWRGGRGGGGNNRGGFRGRGGNRGGYRGGNPNSRGKK